MTKTETPIVLFYPTGVVHFRNLETLKRKLTGFQFRVMVEPWVLEKAPEVLASFKEEDRAIIKDGKFPDSMWDNVDILFLSMAYPNLFRLSLVQEAAKRGIPVTAIEEVNQLALNDGIINHYFLPVDYFGVPSQVEKQRFVHLGILPAVLKTTGWPFFNPASTVAGGHATDIRVQYSLSEDQKVCLLVLGSLKEFDMVSLETLKVRRRILTIVAGGLPGDMQLLIKPHPIETDAALRNIRKWVPKAIVVDPKIPIEPLLAQSDIIVNRGNSQVTLLAMMQQKPVVVVPVGLRTVFHGTLDIVIAETPDRFREILDRFQSGQVPGYSNLLKTHFPLNQDEALTQVQRMFAQALRDGRTGGMNTRFYISILFAFLGDRAAAGAAVTEFENEPAAQLLQKLYSHQLEAPEFERLLELFPSRMQRWHLQALFIRSLKYRGDKELTAAAMELLDGFDGDVNPHYFIADLVQRIELEFCAGRTDLARVLMEKFYDDYAVFGFYKQAFDMMRFVYGKKTKGAAWRKALWLVMNFNKSYTRKVIKQWLFNR